MPDLQKPRGRTLKLYLVDGSSSGVITAELGISSVRAVVASRMALPDLLRRDEATRTGIYLLVGPDPDLRERQLAYVGEGDQVRTRFAAHDADDAKDFFTRVVLIVSKDENLTKAHGRYLESRIIAAIGAAGTRFSSVEICEASWVTAWPHQYQAGKRPASMLPLACAPRQCCISSSSVRSLPSVSGVAIGTFLPGSIRQILRPGN
ncbi:MAG: GIY-YIG nuclease family protein [Janthinobacterium lividum]